MSGQAKGCISTLIERMTRLYIGILLPNRLAQEIEMAVRQLHPQLPAGAIKTATTDCGKEFSCYQTLEKEWKIADPYSSR